MAQSSEITMNLHPDSVPEFEVDDIVFGRLSDCTEFADPANAAAMLKEVRLSLPPTILHTALTVVANETTPLSAAIPPDMTNFDFFLLEVPLNIRMSAAKQSISRLLLKLD